VGIDEARVAGNVIAVPVPIRGGVDVGGDRRHKVCNREDDRGASAVEYALLIAGIAAVIIVAVTFVGKTVSGQFSKVGSSIASTN
jgi:pilus assembly protein Flp/PilA